jgi:uncharacterized protein
MGGTVMGRSAKIGILLSFQFMIMIYLFTRSLYSPFFILLIVLFLLIAFLSENNRLFSWIIIAFFIGHLLLGYIDNFIGLFRLPQLTLVIISQLLLLVPIVMIHLVRKKFNEANYPFFHKPKMTRENQLFKNITWKQYYVTISMLFILVLIGTLVIRREELTISHLFFSLSFSIVFTGLGEVLWRGILLPHFIKITNKWMGIIVTSIAYGLNMTLFGYASLTTFSYIILGLLFAYVTIKTNSITPSIIMNTMITFILLTSGLVMLPV